MQSTFNIIGLMSGTSLDGLDVIAATFRLADQRWKYEIVASQTIDYSSDLKQDLREAHQLSLEDGIALHMQYGKFLGQQVNDFMLKHKLRGLIDAVASHGHTVLHAPNRGYTFQIGDGAAISAVSGVPVISDLRAVDVSLGGQGAPIVPVGEKYLFPGYKVFVNIGGIVNISFHERDQVTAYDICPGNTPLNLLALLMGSDYDEDGQQAREGSVDQELLSRLEAFSFYKRELPRSLHTYQIINEFMPMMDLWPGSIQDKLATVTEHVASQVCGHLEMNDTPSISESPVMITGGGAMNKYLVERIIDLSDKEIVIPEAQLVNYKEALIMAFLAVLRMQGRPNCLASVTGAERDSSGGAWYAS